jgi:serine/threonine-protein kinase
MLGQSLEQVGRDEDALSAFVQSVYYGGAGNAARSLLIRKGRWDQVAAVWQEAVRKHPSTHLSWDGYAEYCAFAGQVDQYREVRRAILDRFGNDDDPQTCETTGRAGLLLADDVQEVKRAAEAVDRAVNADHPKAKQYRNYFLIARGLAEYRQGKFEAALKAVKDGSARELMPMPQLIAAMAQQRLGRADVARRLLSQAVLGMDWTREKATAPEKWICHVLRREAERMILPSFDALIAGSAEPRDNDERLALLGVCTFEELRGRCAHLWTEALKAAPELAVSRSENAARAMALAGTGNGKDAGKFTDEDRTRSRVGTTCWRCRRLRILPGCASPNC